MFLKLQKEKSSSKSTESGKHWALQKGQKLISRQRINPPRPAKIEFPCLNKPRINVKFSCNHIVDAT